MHSNISTLVSILSSQDFLRDFDFWSSSIADYITKCRDSNLLITIFGNGGSAADAQHWAAELVCTYENRSRSPFPAIADEKRKPLASIPIIASDLIIDSLKQNLSIISLNIVGSASRGIISLKTIPFLGKSGYSLIEAFMRSCRVGNIIYTSNLAQFSI